MADIGTKTPELPPELLKQVVNPWLLGADPEFAVLKPPKDETIPNHGMYFCSGPVLDEGANVGNIGFDHSGRVWELRPAPSSSSYGVVTNLWKLLQSPLLKKVEPFRWKSGALGGLKTHNDDGEPVGNGLHDTLGGHVHYGVPSINAKTRSTLNAITETLLSLDVLARKENAKRLAQGHYGSYNHDSIRPCEGHVEYRCPPSWLDNPGQALAALTVYKLAAARPDSCSWTEGYKIKEHFLDWLSQMSQIDVDAWLLTRLIEKRGFGEIQADPTSDFKPRWRKEELWNR